MKKMIFILVGVLLHSIAQANELKIYVIQSPVRIDWSSPQALAITSGYNSIGKDYAPIGHFAVEVKCSNKNGHKINHILTGMERMNRKESQEITLDKKLGLGSLFYTFKGALQSSKQVMSEIKSAGFDNRLSVLTIPTLAKNCDEMLSFVDDWITHGSYHKYGGGKNTAEGEGAGCADFAIQLFEIATEDSAPLKWYADVIVPYGLIGDGKDKKIDFTKLLQSTSWASTTDTGRPFKIVDTFLVTDWIKSKVGYFRKNYEFKTNKAKLMARHAQGVHYQRPEFTYDFIKKDDPKIIWNKIKTQ